MGKLFSPLASYLKSVFDSPVCVNLCPGPSGWPALGVYSHRVLGNMSVGPFNMNSEGCDIAPQAHGPDAQGIDGVIELIFHFGEEGVMIMRTHRPGDRFFSQLAYQVSGPSDSHSDDPRWAGIGAGL